MSRAERHLLATGDALVTQFDALEEQREEFEAILRSMTEAVVVTGVARRSGVDEWRGASALRARSRSRLYRPSFRRAMPRPAFAGVRCKGHYRQW